MGAHRVTIGSPSEGTEKVFKSKNEAILFFRNMLHRYGNNQEVDDEDSRLLSVPLECHPEAQQKIGCGITRFHKKTYCGASKCSRINIACRFFLFFLTARQIDIPTEGEPVY